MGSGFLVGGRRILTAAHNIESGRLTIRFLDGRELKAVHVPAPSAFAQDMATLEITSSSFSRDVPPIRFANVDREFGQVLEHCWAVGFPRWKEKLRGPNQSPLRDSVQLRGDIATGSNRVSGRLEFLVPNSPRPLSSTDQSEWEGMSGAPVFYNHPVLGTVCVGVIAQHHLPEGESSLTVEPFLADQVNKGKDAIASPGAGALGAPSDGGDQFVQLIGLGSRAELDLQHDTELLRRQLVVFRRSAFRVACIEELFLDELREAIDNSMAALDTGSLYSRRDERGGANLLQTFDDVSRYRLPEFRSTLRLVVSRLAQLKRQVLEFEHYFRTMNPGYSHHANFYAMVQGFVYDPGRGFRSEETRGAAPRPNHDVVAELIDRMVAIDDARNEILISINALLVLTGDQPLELISPTSREVAEAVSRDLFPSAPDNNPSN
ncbi:serine protease [Ornithinimicrobium sp. LYQ103]|uniref:S1 family peptidase n=1 Tax=Ornithinimicrobium sp. LYQ103 TaxID=3378796 RepID=UPI0038540C5F